MPRPFRRPIPADAPGLDVSGNRQLPLSTLLDGPRLGRSDTAADATWLALRMRLGEVECGSDFDPRHMLRLEGVALREWEAARRAWLADVFRDDPRVDVSR